MVSAIKEDNWKGGAMKIKNFIHINKEQPITLIKDQVLSVQGKQLSVECFSGTIWITWTNGPNGHERTLREGQSCSILSKGKVCLTTFKTACIAVKLQVKPRRFLKKYGNMATPIQEDQSPVLLPWNFA